MKPNQAVQLLPPPLTLGGLITSLYASCDRRRAVALLKLAVNAQLLVLPRQQRVALRPAHG